MINAEAEFYSSDVNGKLTTKGTIVHITIDVSMLQDKDDDIINVFDYN